MSLLPSPGKISSVWMEFRNISQMASAPRPHSSLAILRESDFPFRVIKVHLRSRMRLGNRCCFMQASLMIESVSCPAGMLISLPPHSGLLSRMAAPSPGEQMPCSRKSEIPVALLQPFQPSVPWLRENRYPFLSSSAGTCRIRLIRREKMPVCIIRMSGNPQSRLVNMWPGTGRVCCSRFVISTTVT